MWPRARFGLFALAFGLMAGRARAQGNELSAPTGGRSALMGNTGVALGRDGSAPFLNPATIVRIDDNSLAFAVNFYTFSATQLSGWHEPGSVLASRFGNVSLSGTSVSTNSFRILPSTLCLFFTIRGVTEEGTNDAGQHRGRQKLSVCFGSTEFEDVILPALSFRATTPLGMTTQVQSITRDWNRYQAGPTYSVSLGDFAIGASLQGIYTSEGYVFDSSGLTSAQGGAIQSTFGAGGSAHAFDLTAILGATYRAGKITFGASVQLPSLHLFGNYSATLHSEYGVGGVDNAALSIGSGGFSAPAPMRFAIGAGAEWQGLVLELDGSFQLPVGSITSSVNGSTTSLVGTTASNTPLNSTFAIDQHPAWNTALGAEYFFSKSFSILGGASTNLTTLRSLSPTSSLGNLVQARTSQVLASVGIGSYGGGADILIGTQLGYTWGQSMAVNPYVLPNDFAVVGTHTYSVMLILAGATNLRAIRRAVEKVQNAVTTGNPELPATPPKGAAQPGTNGGTAPANGNKGELPRSGASDPRNVVDPDTGHPAPPKGPPTPGTPSDAPRTTPSPLLDPTNRNFPPH